MKKLIKIGGLFILMAIVPSCDTDQTECDNPETPEANFEYSRYKCDGANLCVHFQNLSQSIDKNTSYHWTFGDGTESNQENPSHKYSAFDVYNVVLKVSNCKGESTFYSESVPVIYE